MYVIFQGEIMDILSEKPYYEYFNNIKKSMENLNLESAQKEMLKDLYEVEPLLYEYLEKIEKMKTRALFHIKQFEGFLKVKDEKAKVNTITKPSKLLEKYDDSDLRGSKEEIKNIYMLYLINFYFYAQESSRYLEKIKSIYKDDEIVKSLEINVEKIKLLEALNSRIYFKEKEYLKEEWTHLRKEDVFLEANKFLNEKIKEYVKENDEIQFLADLSRINKIP